MKKQKLAFVDHSFHVKTRSGDFLRNIFKEKYIIHDIWVDRNLEFKRKIFDFDNIFFFQILPPLKILNKLKDKNLIWAPMYDSPHHPIGFTPLLWKITEYYNIKILSFSKKLTNQISKYKINFLDLKYFVKPRKNNKKVNNKLNVLFWNRGDIAYDDWSKVILKKDIGKIIYFDTQPENRTSHFKNNKFVKYIHKPFSSRGYFRRLIMQSNVFICPRLKEGIGMANVEALALGKYIISNNDATMSEYIINEKIGIFYNYWQTKKLSIEFVRKFDSYRYNYALKGYKNFKNKKSKILKLINKKVSKNYNDNYHFLLIFLFKLNALKRKLLMIFQKLS